MKVINEPSNTFLVLQAREVVNIKCLEIKARKYSICFVYNHYDEWFYSLFLNMTYVGRLVFFFFFF